MENDSNWNCLLQFDGSLYAHDADAYPLSIPKQAICEYISRFIFMLIWLLIVEVSFLLLLFEQMYESFVLRNQDVRKFYFNCKIYFIFFRNENWKLIFLLNIFPFVLCMFCVSDCGNMYVIQADIYITLVDAQFIFLFFSVRFLNYCIMHIKRRLCGTFIQLLLLYFVKMVKSNNISYYVSLSYFSVFLVQWILWTIPQ